jgi:NAD+ diphosphatase
VVPRPDGKILLMTKEFYPQGVYRLPTGRIRQDERPEGALSREVREETGLDLEMDQLLTVLRYTFHCNQQSSTFTSYIYIMKTTEKQPQSQDEAERISGFRYATPPELQEIARNLYNLEPPWDDWGRFRAIAHEVVAKTEPQES